jgi:leucyl aminopeptidase
MQFHLDAAPWVSAEGDWLIVGVAEGFEMAGPLVSLDKALGGQITRLREQQDFSGKLAEVVPLRGVAGIKANRVLLVGLGAADKLDAGSLHKSLVTAARHVSTKATKCIAVVVPEVGADATTLGRRVEATAVAMQVGCVGQDLHRTERKRFPFETVHLLVSSGSDVAKLRASLNDGQIIGDAINLARELVNRPAMEIFPVSFAERAEEVARQVGLRYEVLDEKALIAEKMGSLLAVSAGSDQPPRLVVLEHNAAPTGSPVLALVGKGVTFDSGGLSLKPTDGMLTMKCDMAGAATVLATMSVIAQLKLPIHVIGFMGLVENMTGGKAMKLGDVLTSRAGVTIEVLNTDAEGRLVLADVLDYAVSRGADQIVDLATLTGACVVALGEEVVGAMSNNQPWCDKLLAAARAAGEDMWQLPMFDHYNELIKGDVGDIKNTGGRWGGAITAAKFLEKFVKDKPWVHLDIAGPAFASSDKPHREGGGSGCMVRTLVELVRRGS